MKADDAAEEIRKLNYQASVQDKPDPRIKNTYIRFFFEDDEQFAREIQKQIRLVGIDATIQGFADEPDRGVLGYIKPKTLELWLGSKYRPLADPHIAR